MTLQERLDQLVAGGAVLQMPSTTEPMSTHLLAAAKIKHKPSRLRWAAVFPEHQSHVHETAYDIAVVVHDRDISFAKNGRIMAYVAPYAEAETDIDELQDTLSEWRAQLDVGENAKEFARFFETA